MPQSAQQKYDPYIPTVRKPPSPASAQRNIHIIRKPFRQADVPSLPKFPDIVRAIWILKILHEPDSQQKRRAPRNICVPGKITVNLD
jgi:hypothetical protein